MPPRNSQRPPAPEPVEEPNEHVYDDEDERDFDVRPGLDRILPELIRRGLGARGQLGKMGESIFPRELASSVVAQLGDIRSGVVKAVAQEVGRFLREADIATEVKKVLNGLDVEAAVRLSFKARDDGGVRPDVQVRFGDERPSRSSTPPDGERSK